jgi:fatty-acyl-CoA synthase
MYIGDYLGRRAIYSPDKIAIIDYGKNPEWRLTYRQMNERANKLASYFKSIGIGKGDRVANFARDGIEHLDTFFACAKLGAIHTAFNWRLHWREAVDIIENTTPKVLIYSDDFKSIISEIEHATRNSQFAIPNYIHLEGNGIANSKHFESTLQNSATTPVKCESLEAEDIAALIFTGGTTGLPKAAQVSHRMIAWNTLNTVIHDVSTMTRTSTSFRCSTRAACSSTPCHR